MQLIGGPNGNSTSCDPSQGPGTFNTGVAARGGVIILHNLSPYELLITFNNDPTRSMPIFAWQQRKIDFCGKQTDTISYSTLFEQGGTSNTPSSVIFGEAYAPGEPVPDSLPNYDRLSNVGNTVSTTGSSQSLNNTGNPPGTLVYSTEPNDQTVAAEQEYNDGSGTRQILSAGSQRSIWNFTRGSSTAKASVVFGDTGDRSIFTFNGNAYSSTYMQNQGSGARMQSVWDSTTRQTRYQPTGFGGDVTQVIDGFTSTGSVYNEGVRVNPDGSVGLALNTVQINYAGNFSAIPNGAIPAAAVAAGAVGLGAFSFQGASGSSDAIRMHNDTDNTLFASLGYRDSAQGGVGMYAYDNKNNAYIFYNATSNGIAFNGVVYINEYKQITDASDGNTYMGYASDSGNTGEWGIFTNNKTAVMQSTTNGVFLKWNNRFNGSVDYFVSAATNAWQVALGPNGIQARVSTNAPAAGGAITWGPFFPLMAVDYGSSARTPYTNWPAGAIAWMNSGV